jgi:orotate phosphoribosyltransferase-like protein
MSADAPSLPQRAARVSDEVMAQIVQLAIRQVSHADIARRVGVNRKTVKRVVDRTRAALAINQDLAVERAEAIAVYREVQRTAWQAVEQALERGRSPAMSLAEVRLAQTRIDHLLGLAPTGPDDPLLLLAEFKAAVLTVIQAEAPELGPRIAQRLLEARSER